MRTKISAFARLLEWRSVVRYLTPLVALWLIVAPAARANAQTPAPLAAAGEAAAELPRIHSLLVSWRGALVLERYYNGARATSPANIKSASKSIISALVGIAIDRGDIKASASRSPTSFRIAYRPKTTSQARDHDRGSADDAVGAASRRATATTARGCRAATGSGTRSTRPLLTEPGTYMDYSTGNSHLLSAILTKATGKSTWQFAQEALAKPLGFSLAQWPRDPQGIYFGGNDMLMTPRQMVAFGELYLKKGNVSGRQVVPATWIEASFVPRTRSRLSDQTYGYGWWMRELAGQDVRSRGVTAASSSSSCRISISWSSRPRRAPSTNAAAIGARSSTSSSSW